MHPKITLLDAHAPYSGAPPRGMYGCEIENHIIHSRLRGPFDDGMTKAYVDLLPKVNPCLKEIGSHATLLEFCDSIEMPLTFFVTLKMALEYNESQGTVPLGLALVCPPELAGRKLAMPAMLRICEGRRNTRLFEAVPPARQWLTDLLAREAGICPSP